MKSHFLYCFKDCDVFTPMALFEEWKIVVDKTPERNVLEVLLPGNVRLTEAKDLQPYVHKARLPLLFPTQHIVIDNFIDETFEDYQQKNTLL